jgi:hypothetical protein
LQPRRLRPQAVAELRADARERETVSKVVGVSVYKSGVVNRRYHAVLENTLRIYRIEPSANMRQ